MRALSSSEGRSGGAWPGGPPPPPMDMEATMRDGGFSADGTSRPYAARAATRRSWRQRGGGKVGLWFFFFPREGGGRCGRAAAGGGGAAPPSLRRRTCG